MSVHPELTERAKELLAAATPVPWEGFPWGARGERHGMDVAVFQTYSQDRGADAALIVFAVNHLPELVAALVVSEQQQKRLRRKLTIIARLDDAVVVKAELALRETEADALSPSTPEENNSEAL